MPYLTPSVNLRIKPNSCHIRIINYLRIIVNVEVANEPKNKSTSGA